MTASVVRLGAHKTQSVVDALESAMERAKQGEIDGFVMVECGRDVGNAALQARISVHMSRIDEPVAVLACAGGLDYIKRDLIDCLDT